jgi:hypothetical protein
MQNCPTQPRAIRTAVGDPNGFGAHGLDELGHGKAEYRIAVEDEVSWRGIVWKRVPQLLNHPRCCRMESCIEVQDTSATMLDDKEPVQQSERYGRYNEQVHRGDVVFVVPQERDPSLYLVGL